MHAAALRFRLQCVSPRAVVRQQVTKPGRRAAHRTTVLRHSGGRLPAVAAVFAASATQRTYAPWLAAVAHGHDPSPSPETNVDAVNGSVYCAGAPSGAFLD